MMGNALCREALLGQAPNYSDYVDDEGNFDCANYVLSLAAWHVRNGATLKDCLRDRKKKRLTKKNHCINRKKKRYRSCYRLQATTISEQGVEFLCIPKASNWYSQYVYTPRHCEETRTSKRFNKQFHQCFRLPYEQFEELVMEMKHSNHFQRWMHTDAAKWESSPLELLLLGTLRYLSHGWTFDDLEEAMNINKEISSNLAAQCCLINMFACQQMLKKQETTCRSILLLGCLGVLVQPMQHM